MPLRADKETLELLRKAMGRGGRSFLEDVEAELGEPIQLSHLRTCIRQLLERNKRIELRSVVAGYQAEQKRVSIASAHAKALRLLGFSASKKVGPRKADRVTLKGLRPGPPPKAVAKSLKKAKKAKGRSVWVVYTPSGGQPSRKGRRHP